jgi:hypothetical protein
MIASLVARGCKVIGVETRIYASPDVWGTLDVALYDPLNDTLMVLDYKNGVKPVSADNNVQLQCYAWGAWLKFNHEFAGDKVCMGIIQPNSSNNEIFTTCVKYVIQLFDFYLYMRECVEVAKAPDAPVRAGHWCFWCEAKSICTTYKEAQAQPPELDRKHRSIFNKIMRRDYEQSTQ